MKKTLVFLLVFLCLAPVFAQSIVESPKSSDDDDFDDYDE